MRPSLLGVLLVLGCGGGGGGGGKPVDPKQLFGPSRFVASVWQKDLLSNVTVVLDTSMEPAALEEAAAAVSAWVDARATGYRFALVESGPMCGPGNRRVALPANVHDVPDELRANADAIRMALGSVAPTSKRSTLGALPTAKINSERFEAAVLITQGADGCGADARQVVADSRKRDVRTFVMAYRPAPDADAFFTTVATEGGTKAYCPGGTDAECGPGNACTDVMNAQCQRPYFQAMTQQQLSDQLLALTPVFDDPPPRTTCGVWFGDPPPKAKVSRVFVAGVEQKNNWTAEPSSISGLHLLLTGAPCAAIQAADRYAPVTIEIEVPFSLGL